MIIYRMIKAFFSLPVMFGSWFDHVKSWLNAEDKERIMYISYEEMKMVRGNINPQKLPNNSGITSKDSQHCEDKCRHVRCVSVCCRT